MKNNVSRKFKILIVDDEPLVRESLFEILKMDGYQVRMASSGEEAVDSFKEFPVDVVLADLKLPRMDGIQLLEKVKERSPKTEIILMTGYGSIESAVEAMKKGAFDYITKPINDSEIKVVLEKIFEKRKIVEENESLKEMLAQECPDSFAGMVGGSPAMQKVYHVIRSVASTNATILITGESGTGKGLIAKAIHANDINRKTRPFIEISCGALTETLLESELFGHVKGAFTGAIKDKPGRFEYAEGGTIFLDEIDTFSLNLQVKLLRVLQDGVFERVGDNATLRTDARIIVATNQHLPDLIAEGKFREDLYYRINVIAIEPPPLRERKDDIPALIDHFIQEYAKKNQKTIAEIDDEVVDVFLEYEWPGNIRELENAIEGAVIMAKDQIIHQADIPNVSKFKARGQGKVVPAQDKKSLKQAVEQPEKDYIISILDQCRWNRNQAAEKLGINRTTLYNKMKKYQISDPE